MSQNIIDKIKKSRQIAVTVKDHKFIIRRPTVHEYLQYRTVENKVFIPVDHLPKFVDDWPGMTELDLWSGGTGDTVPYSQDIFLAWVTDHPEIWAALISKILELFNNWYDTRENEAKNS